MDVLEQILTTWYKNNELNLKILKFLPDEALEYTISPRGGGRIGYQLTHLYNVRYYKLERLNKEALTGFSLIRKEDKPGKAEIENLLRKSAALIAEELKEAVLNDFQFNKGHKGGVISLLGYFLNHEAHHRGNILLTLKSSPFKFKKEQKYELWDWGKLLKDQGE